MPNPATFLLVASTLLVGCSHIQFGRDFDDSGEEVERASGPATSASASNADESHRVSASEFSSNVDKFDEDYYGEDLSELPNAFHGQLGEVSVKVIAPLPEPYADTRLQRMPGIWRLWGKSDDSPVESVESKAAENRVLSLFSAKKSNGDAVAEELPAMLVNALSSQLSQEIRSDTPQQLRVQMLKWGLSDRIGLYSTNLRVEMHVEASLLDSLGRSLWTGRLRIDAGEPDRPMAAASEFETHAELLSQHLEIASQFIAHRIITSITGRAYSQPNGYEASDWIDLE